METIIEKRKVGRPSQFVKEEVVKEVTQLFWTHGYRSLSMNFIAQATGLKRSSLYNRFKSKEELYKECLDYYTSQSPISLLRNFDKTQRVGPLLSHVVLEIIKERSQDKNRRGCMAENIFDEVATEKSKVSDIVHYHYNKQYQTLFRLFEIAIHSNELSGSPNAKTLTLIFLTFINGINIHVKKGVSHEDLKTLCLSFIKMLGFQ